MRTPRTKAILAILLTALVAVSCGGRLGDATRLAPDADIGGSDNGKQDASSPPLRDGGGVGDSDVIAADAVASDAPDADGAAALDVSNCLTGGNVLFTTGRIELTYPDPFTLSGSNVSWLAEFSGSLPPSIQLYANTSQEQWTLHFAGEANANSDPVTPLHIGTYDDVARAFFAASGQAGLDVSDGTGCNTVHGRFEITDLQINGSTIDSFTAAFEQRCDGNTYAIRGCVHVEHLAQP